MISAYDRRIFTGAAAVSRTPAAASALRSSFRPASI
jgi:hypothetical protein